LGFHPRDEDEGLSVGTEATHLFVVVEAGEGEAPQELATQYLSETMKGHNLRRDSSGLE
jgi:hypothetical protein